MSSPQEIEDANATLFVDVQLSVLIANDAFLALDSPTADDVLIQMRVISRGLAALVHIVQNRYDDTDGM
jgi:hypothetical protein